MIYIVVRQTTDWDDEATFRAQIPADIQPAVELWNATFNMPYHLFRRELKRIAQLSLSRVQGAVCVRRDEVPKDAVVMCSDTAALIANHMHASHWFLAHPPVVKRLGERLSVMNRTVASRTSLRSQPSRSALIRKFRRYEKVYRRALPPELAWCEPYVALMRDLMDQLRLRR
jgi:hypothetical protein